MKESSEKNKMLESSMREKYKDLKKRKVLTASMGNMEGASDD